MRPAESQRCARAGQLAEYQQAKAASLAIHENV